MGDQLQLRPELHRDQDYGTTPTVDLAETLSEIGQKLRKGWKSLFGSETTVSDKQTTSTAVVSSHVATEQCVSTEGLCIPQTQVSRIEIFPELSDLSYSERSLVSQPFEDVLQNIRSMVMKGCHVESETVYNQVFSLIPSSVVSELTSAMNSCQSLSSRLVRGDESYEEILRRYMECASDMNSFRNALGAPWIFDNLQNASKLFDVIVKLINKFSSKAYNTIESDIIPLKPIALALLWALLLMRLTSKYTNSCADFERDKIARLSISLVLSLFAGFTGYVHSGGYTGVPSVTSWLRTFYMARTTFGREFPYFYHQIPHFLKFNECTNFNNLMRSQQKDAGQGMNMVYTFRVGDSLLKKLEGSKLISDDVIKSTLRSIWPLPSEYEAGRMYKLYTTDRLYYIS